MRATGAFEDPAARPKTGLAVTDGVMPVPQVDLVMGKPWSIDELRVAIHKVLSPQFKRKLGNDIEHPQTRSGERARIRIQDLGPKP